MVPGKGGEDRGQTLIAIDSHGDGRAKAWKTGKLGGGAGTKGEGEPISRWRAVPYRIAGAEGPENPAKTRDEDGRPGEREEDRKIRR